LRQTREAEGPETVLGEDRATSLVRVDLWGIGSSGTAGAEGAVALALDFPDSRCIGNMIPRLFALKRVLSAGGRASVDIGARVGAGALLFLSLGATAGSAGASAGACDGRVVLGRFLPLGAGWGTLWGVRDSGISSSSSAALRFRSRAGCRVGSVGKAAVKAGFAFCLPFPLPLETLLAPEDTGSTDSCVADGGAGAE